MAVTIPRSFRRRYVRVDTGWRWSMPLVAMLTLRF